MLLAADIITPNSEPRFELGGDYCIFAGSTTCTVKNKNSLN